MMYTKTLLAATVLMGAFIFASPVAKKGTDSSATKAAPQIIVQSACRSMVINPASYRFVLDPVTEAYYGTLYFNFCHPATGVVVASVANSQSGTRTVHAPTITTYKVIVSTSPVTQVNYNGFCGYSTLAPGGLSASRLICAFIDCDTE